MKANSNISCGVDQAHLHLIIDAPFSIDDIINIAKKHSKTKWHKTDPSVVYEKLSIKTSYLMVSDQSNSFFTEGVDDIESQFFRRIIASLVGKERYWNYRQFPFISNVKETISVFGDKANYA